MIHVIQANKTMTHHKDGYHVDKYNYLSEYSVADTLSVVPEYRYFSMLVKIHKVCNTIYCTPKKRTPNSSHPPSNVAVTYCIMLMEFQLTVLFLSISHNMEK